MGYEPGWDVVMRALKIAGIAVAAVVGIVVLLLAVGIPSSYLTSAIQARVERQTGYRLTIAGTTKIGIWPSLNVTMTDVTLANGAVQNAGDSDAGKQLAAGSIQAEMTLAGIWSGHPQITTLVMTRPVLSVPLLRERTPQPTLAQKTPLSPDTTQADALTIDRVTIVDGAIAFSNLRDRVNRRIDGINAQITIGNDRKIDISGRAATADHPLKFTIKATAPTLPIERQTIPVEIALDTSGLSQAPLTAKADIRLNGSVVMINGLSGKLDDGAFNGWASVDLASKPLVKLDLDFQRLAFAKPAASTSSADSQQPLPWSSATIDVSELNYVDVQARISAAELNIGDAHFAPAAIEAALAGGVLKCGFSNLGAYDGQANGEFSLDVANGNPVYTLRTDLVGISALPLFKGLADFDKLDGKMQAKLALRSQGNSQRAIMSSIDGTAFTNFRDGAIKGLNVAQMIRSLTSGTLSGWQQSNEQATDLAQLSASFRIEKGQATSTDLNLVGPLVRMTGAGAIDLGQKTLAFRVEPKLVMTTQGQGRAADPVGFGVPVIVEGPWSNPRIYPDIADITNNPDAAYARLKEMGKGLFGGAGNGSGQGSGQGSDNGSGNGTSDPLGGSLGQTLNNLIQQGLGRQGLGQQGSGRESLGQPSPNSSRGSAQGRSIPPQPNDPPAAPQDSQPMNDILKQLFNR
jgi:AsmA protein